MSEYSFNHNTQLVEVLNTDEKEETEKRVEERVSLSRTGTNGKIRLVCFAFYFCAIAQCVVQLLWSCEHLLAHMI